MLFISVQAAERKRQHRTDVSSYHYIQHLIEIGRLKVDLLKNFHSDTFRYSHPCYHFHSETMIDREDCTKRNS